ncbi:MAG: VCBS repeat-containing protein [Silvanigrellales bacterium]|nr:VCBS repeat-containing protein [Silvanigrellales bacterium]
MPSFRERLSCSVFARDPRWAVLVLLSTYLCLGFTVLGFNRSPWQVLVTSLLACTLEVGLHALFKRKLIFPLSALITSLGLSLLLNYAHGFTPLLIPVLFAIGSKYVFTFKGKHVYNPAQFAVVMCLLFTNELITSAPAYQWNGLGAMSVFIAMPAVLFFVPGINRTPLILSFLGTYTLVTAARALVMRHHLPFETLFLGTLSSPSFFLFVFFMITDPATSPKARKDQIQVGILLAVIDLIYHLFQSYYTFFYAAFTVASYRFIVNHVKECVASKEGAWGYVRNRALTVSKQAQFPVFPVWIRVGAVSGLVASALALFVTSDASKATASELGFRFEKLPVHATGVSTRLGNIYERVDPRIQHVIKWVFSVGSAVAAGDFDEDGLPDLAFTSPLMSDGERVILYRNSGAFRFERFQFTPDIERSFVMAEERGLATNAVFADYDNDDDLDLFFTFAFGSPMLLRNTLRETGTADFVDVTKEAGLTDYFNSIAATFLDVNRDGRLDLLVGAVIPDTLPGYESPTPLNFFRLPSPAFPGDERMFNFMHHSWNEANNGGVNALYLQGDDGRFERQDASAWGMPETRWTLAFGTGDLNQDGYTDVYVANDFGPDDLYLNEGGKRFRNVKGTLFGTMGRDTYKGMNASVQDFDRNGWLDVYVSNVHHALQAEGSLLWMFEKGKDSFVPRMADMATRLGALNERRFGWGAAASDFNNDGWIDIAQANGMVDDTPDRKWDECPDYWYTNEKIARSPPSIHTYANKWGDIRGRCIYGKERNRLYLNQGNKSLPQFIDVASGVGLTEETNSRGMASVDLNNDGRLDLVVTHMFAGPDIYRNLAIKRDGFDEDVTPQSLTLELEGNGLTCNRDGLGSRVTVAWKTPHGTQATLSKEAQAVDGLSAQNDRRLHFGLGLQPRDVRVSVLWCGTDNRDYGSMRPQGFATLRQ